jgi:hypothetical protein
VKLFQPRYSKPEGGAVGRSLEKNAEPPLTPVDNADKKAFVAFVSTPQGGLAENRDNSAGSEPPTLPPVTLLATLLESARARLEEYRATYGVQTAQSWLEHAKRAVEAVRATFPPERRPYALTNYLARNCEGQPAQVIAAHVIALELWAADKRQRQNGVWLDVACQAAGLEPDALAGSAGEAARPNTPWEELI